MTRLASTVALPVDLSSTLRKRRRRKSVRTTKQYPTRNFNLMI
jgi:hypothetical protein